MPGLCVTLPVMDFNELIALMREPGDREIPGTIYDDLTLAHTTALDGAGEKVALAEAANAELLAEVSRLKALNFDLLMAASGDTPPADETDTTTETDSVPSLDSLFERD